MAMRDERPDPPGGRDELDWDALVRQFRPRLRRRMARSVPDPAILDDVVQEALVDAYRGAKTYDRTRPIWPWLVGIAAKRAWQWSQASLRAAELEESDVTAFGVGREPLLDYLDAGSDDHVTNLHRRSAMRRALQGMTEKHRRILLAWELGDRNVERLAEIEGMTTEELRATVVRARRSLRRRYLDAAGEAFGWVVVGVGGLAGRFRDRFTRIASTSGLTEAAGTFAAAPVVAVAGMAMITLMPPPPSQAPPVGTLAEQPVAFVREAPTPAAAGGVPAAAASTPSPATAAPPAPTAPAADVKTSTLSAGPAAASMTSSSGSQQMQLEVGGPTDSAESRRWNAVNCEYNVATTAFCQVSGGLTPQE